MDFSEFVGLPWADRGRGPEGYDCYGLARAVFAAGTGIELPSHADDYSSAADRAEIAAAIAGGAEAWQPIAVGDEAPFDFALMVIAGRQHVGVIVRRGWMLHQPFRKTSVIERLSRFPPGLQLYRYAGARS